MKVKKTVTLSVICALMFFMLARTRETSVSVCNALVLCAESLIPSLFPFFVVSGILVNLGFVELFGKILSPVARVLFKTSGSGAVVFVIGIVCGYPTGAKVIAEMYKDKKLKKEEAERLLAFCNNSGPLFVIGAVGSNMLKNHSLGVALYIIHLLSAVFTGILFRYMGNSEKNARLCAIYTENIGRAISKSIESAVVSILNVCGYVVFFSVFCTMVKHVALVSLLEVSMGAKSIVLCGFSERVTFMLLSGILGFGGICVLFQIQSAVSGTGLSLRLYIPGKIFQACVSFVMAFLYVNLFEIKPAFANVTSSVNTVHPVLMMFIICAVYTVFCLMKKCINKNCGSH